MPKSFLLLFAAFTAFGATTDQSAAENAAVYRLNRDGILDPSSITGMTELLSSDGDMLLARVFELSPAGYVVVSADDALPPVIAYSYSSGFGYAEGQCFGMAELVRLDLENRMRYLDSTPAGITEANRSMWRMIASSEMDIVPSTLLEQWPPAGSTPTGGWLMENWTQGAPYNAYCPMDLLAGSRSVAGCPAVAMGMILDNLETTNETRFTDSDDYHHIYQENYWIDDDHVAHDFPSWPVLNGMLDILDTHYEQSTPLTNSDKAALVFACGSACTQVYSASGSGTFGVGQAYDAYLRFGITDCELLDAESDSLYEKLSQNMMDTLPAHLAIVDAAWQYGHNIVVDGYNTDDYYHFNFGWGGSTNGWYQFPLSGMPYSMNIIEGLILNISIPQTSIEGDDPHPDAQLSLSCLTNPCPSTPSLSLELAEAGPVAVSVFSLDGRLAGTLLDGFVDAGTHQIAWNLDTPSGIYVIRAAGPVDASVLKLVILD